MGNIAKQILSSPNPEKEINRLITTICQLHKENYNLKNNTMKQPSVKEVLRSFVDSLLFRKYHKDTFWETAIYTIPTIQMLNQGRR